MSDLAKAGVNQLVDVVDTTSKAALVALQETENAAVATVEGVINVGDATFDAALQEAESLRQQYVASLRKIAAAVTDIVPG